jgi:uncharacterized membrane protein YhaH (DUF805 family)
MVSASTNYFKRFYFSVQGRTGRRAYWLFMVLPAMLFGMALGFIAPAIHMSPQSLLVVLLLLAPLLIWVGVAVSVKRLHDFGLNGWWVIVCCIPYLNYLTVVVLGLIPGQRGANAYGDAPVRSSAVSL